MTKKLMLLGLLSMLGFTISAQNQIRWISWEEAIEKNDVKPKKFFVDVYTEWCGWCKKMDKATFQNDDIAKYVNDNYYPIKFDAEYKKPIRFNGNVYEFVKTFRGGYHELAAAILNGKLSYPSLVFLDEDYNLIQSIPGFQSKKDLAMILEFYGGDHHKTTAWRKFARNYQANKNKNNKGLGIPVGN